MGKRLSSKLLLTLLLSTLAAVALGFGSQRLLTLGVRNIYCSPARQEIRLQNALDRFRDFVRLHNIRSMDVEKIGAWNAENPFLQLAVSGNGAVLRSDRQGAELLWAENGFLFQSESLRDRGRSFPVTFRDGSYPVQFLDTSEDFFYRAANILAVLLSFVLFIALVLLYNRQVTQNIRKLNRQVRSVSHGNLDQEIHPSTRDEIGELAADVETMRQSVIHQLLREEQAWKANSELITAMSHDVRTPLTTLTGYLDLLAQGKDLTEAQRQEYLEICRSKAGQLRELTDELFSYFLVFGQREPEQHLDDFEAQTLLEQLLGEGLAELLELGFSVDPELPGFPGTIRVDVSHVKRVFDNIFSNLRKYADPAQPIRIRAGTSPGILTVSVQNHISPQASKVESTKIGLKTCEKLMSAMGGSFAQEGGHKTFTAIVRFPLKA